MLSSVVSIKDYLLRLVIKADVSNTSFFFNPFVKSSPNSYSGIVNLSIVTIAQNGFEQSTLPQWVFVGSEMLFEKVKITILLQQYDSGAYLPISTTLYTLFALS